MSSLPTQQLWNCCVGRAGGEAGTLREGWEALKSHIAAGLPFLEGFFPLFFAFLREKPNRAKLLHSPQLKSALLECEEPAGSSGAAPVLLFVKQKPP